MNKQEECPTCGGPARITGRDETEYEAIKPKVLAEGRATMTRYTEGTRQYIRVYLNDPPGGAKPVRIVAVEEEP